MITARSLARTFKTKGGPVQAVVGIDLDVAAGEIVGFLGPNGAGKTTTLRMLTTLLRPSAGEASVAGCDLRGDPVGVRRRIGYVPQSGSTLPEARAGEEVVDQARLYGIDARTATARRDTLFDQLQLEGLAARPCSSLSGGQRRRLDIVMGLIHTPVLVFLDEPSTGLDPQSRANLWEHIRALRSDMGTTVFVTTHYLEEADSLCDRILIIDHGQIVAVGSGAELKRQVAGDTITLVVSQPDQLGGAAAVAVTVAGSGAAVPGGPGAVTAEERTVTVRVPDSATVLAPLLHQLDAQAIAVEAVEVRQATLDDVFLTLTGRTLRDDAA